jgi:hypothetical protein
MDEKVVPPGSVALAGTCIRYRRAGISFRRKKAKLIGGGRDLSGISA